LELKKNKTFMEKYEAFYYAYIAFCKKLIKKVLSLLATLAKNLLIYGFLSFIYLGIYDAWGLEKTIVLLLVAVVFFTLRGGIK